MHVATYVCLEWLSISIYTEHMVVNESKMEWNPDKLRKENKDVNPFFLKEYSRKKSYLPLVKSFGKKFAEYVDTVLQEK